MLVDKRLDAHLHTMFMVQYQETGMALPHDHPFEESYYMLEGEVDVVADDARYTLRPGDAGPSGLHPRLLQHARQQGEVARDVRAGAARPPLVPVQPRLGLPRIAARVEGSREDDDVTETADLSVGFIGLGRMGTPMARRVADAGFSLTVWNRTDERCEPLSSIGAAVAETPKALAEQCDVVVTMVADADALRAILKVTKACSQGCARSRSSSTRAPSARPRRSTSLRPSPARGSLDRRSVSGSTALAEKGELALMIGGEAAAIERAGPVLDVLSAKRFHLGGAGAERR